MNAVTGTYDRKMPDAPALGAPRPASERRVDEDPKVVRAWAEEYVLTGSAEMACRRVKWFDTRYSLAVWARRVLDRPDVQMEVLAARAAGIGTQRAVEPHSRDAVVEDLDEIREGAVMDGAWSAATGAVTTKAKILGYMETTVNINVSTPRELSLDQLRAMVAALPSPEIPDADFEEVISDA